jgi:hypothetical protein
MKGKTWNSPGCSSTLGQDISERTSPLGQFRKTPARLAAGDI